jgi:signal transduction histidine kinase/PAS domain-containing protein
MSGISSAGFTNSSSSGEPEPDRHQLEVISKMVCLDVFEIASSNVLIRYCKRAELLKTKLFLLIIVFAALALVVPAWAQESTPPAQEPLVLTDEQGEYPLGRHMDILEDPTGELTIDQVASTEYASHFVPSEENVPNFGYTSSVFWLRLHLRNETHLTELWLLESQFPNLNYVDLYIPSENGGYLVKQTGALRPFDTRDLPYYHIVFELPLAYQDEKTIYIRVESGSSMTLGFTLWSPEAFAISKIADTVYIGLFYGALLIMLGYHLFLLYRLREIIYFYFVLFLASAILFWATYEGVADQYLWPGMSQQKLPFLAISMAVFFMVSLKFGDVFLELKKRAPGYHRAFNLFIGLWGLMILIVPFVSYSFMAQVTSPLIFLTPAIAAAAGFYNLRNGYPAARFYLISWLGFLLGLITVELVRSDVLPSTPFTEWSYHAGLIWLVLMWSLMLANRINLLKKETEDANRKLLQSQRQLSQTLEGMPLGVVVYGLDRRPSYANPRAISILSNPERGIQAGTTGRRTIKEAIKYFSFRRAGSDEEYLAEKMPVWQAFDGKSASADDVEADLIDRRVPLEIWANPVKDEHGRVESVVAAFQDITQRKQAQAELEAYQRQLEQMVSERTTQLSAVNEKLQAENAERQRLEEMLRLRLEWLVVVNQVNQTIESTRDLPQAYKTFTDMIKKLFGAADALLAELDPQSKNLTLLACTWCLEDHPETSEMMDPLLSIILSDAHFEDGEPVKILPGQLGDVDEPLGAHFQAVKSQSLILVPLRCQGRATGVLGLEYPEKEGYFSVDEMMLMEKICLDILQVKEKARMGEQTRSLIAAEERNRLARDLHDSVTQVLFAASLVAEVLPQIWQRDPALAQAGLAELRRLNRGALADMRTMLLELRPAALIKTPLSDLLAQLTEAITSRTGLPFQLFIEKTPSLPEGVHIAFYRVAQESLNNVVKHAQASHVAVSLSVNSLTVEPNEPWRGEVKLMVRDDGRGFAAQEQESQHMGLVIMRERAAGIGAILTVESLDGSGTTVTLTWNN